MDKLKLLESEIIFKDLIARDKIKVSSKKEADFFLEKANNSLETADRLFRLIFEENLNSQMWIINASYYSMFFAATAILAKKNIKINSVIGIHKLTYHTFVYNFYPKLDENYIKDYKNEIENVSELLIINEKLIEDYKSELEKRKIFTYYMGKIAENSKAKISLERAKRFLRLIEELY